MDTKLMTRIAFIIMGIAVLIIAAVGANYCLNFIEKALSVRGEVISRSVDGSYVKIRFTTHSGKVIEYPQSRSASSSVSDKVTVMYDPEDSHHAATDTFEAIWVHGFLQ